MKEIVTVTYKDVLLEVHGEYFEGDDATLDYPGFSPCFEALKVFVQDVDIFNLFSWENIGEIESLVIEKLR